MWPAGTLLGAKYLTATVAFADAEVTQGMPLRWTATISNPHDSWVFFGFESYNFLGVHLSSANTEGMNVIKSDGVAGTAPEFQHQTSQGVVTGLLLAPHTSYQYSGTWDGTVESPATSDYVVYGEAILDPGYGQGLGAIPGSPGTVHVVMPTASTTTASTTTAPAG